MLPPGKYAAEVWRSYPASHSHLWFPVCVFALPAVHAMQVLLSPLGSKPASQRQSRVPEISDTLVALATQAQEAAPPVGNAADELLKDGQLRHVLPLVEGLYFPKAHGWQDCNLMRMMVPYLPLSLNSGER